MHKVSFLLGLVTIWWTSGLLAPVYADQVAPVRMAPVTDIELAQVVEVAFGVRPEKIRLGSKTLLGSDGDASYEITFTTNSYKNQYERASVCRRFVYDLAIHSSKTGAEVTSALSWNEVAFPQDGDVCSEDMDWITTGSFTLSANVLAGISSTLTRWGSMLDTENSCAHIVDESVVACTETARFLTSALQGKISSIVPDLEQAENGNALVLKVGFRVKDGADAIFYHMKLREVENSYVVTALQH
ncbi:hypothetical protein [Kordiimonas sp.]|uniref:hypothetical protein n=1 Tax=Kordiimonas sp. TaxID=1970157 RepID=UPI003A8CFD2F